MNKKFFLPVVLCLSFGTLLCSPGENECKSTNEMRRVGDKIFTMGPTFSLLFTDVHFFEEKGAFTRNQDGQYHIDIEQAKQAMREWAALILQVEGDGDLATATSYKEKNGGISEKLQADLDKINTAGIPRDIDFIKGKEVLGVK